MKRYPRSDELLEFTKALKRYLRTRTLVTNPKPVDSFSMLLSKNDINYGHINGIVDVLVLDEMGDVLEKIKARYILSTDSRPPKGYKTSVYYHVFQRYGYHLFERKNLIKIAAFPIQKEGAVLWYRLQSPLMVLWRNSPDFDCRLVYPMNYYDMMWADIVIIQRWFPGADGLLNYAKQIGKKVIYETDDLDIYITQENPLFWEYQVGNRLGLMKNMMSQADMITVTTKYLKKEMCVFNRNVEVLRNKIDLTMPMWNVGKTKHDGIIIGWAGGSTHYYDLQIVRGFIQQICNRFQQVKLMICGYSKGGVQYSYSEDKDTGRVVVNERKLERGIWDDIVDDFRKEIGDDRLIVRDALPLDKYGTVFADMDIVVVPLNDTRFCRGKSELKVIEAGVYGCAVVASDVEPYREIVDHGVNGFLARKRKHWIKYLSRLIVDEDLRITLGNNLRELVLKKYDVSNQEDRIKVYRRLVEK